MQRREFISLIAGAAAAWPLRVQAQQSGHVPLIVFWIGGMPSDPEVQASTSAFQDTLHERGWIDGRNIRVARRSYPVSFTPEDMNVAASEITALDPDVIVTTGAPILGALHRVTKTVPIVFTNVTDPVSDGFVTNLARPGENITGFTLFEHSFAGKWLEMLKEVVPSMTRVAVMQSAGHPAWNAYLRAIDVIASGIGTEVTPAPISNPVQIEPFLSDFARAPNGGLLILPSPLVTQSREVIAKAALRYRLPSIYLSRLYAVNGGLMTYGPVISDAYRQAATYVDRILKGVKPGELPVQAASKFEMVINLKTAKALGITVPATMLGRADEVIE